MDCVIPVTALQLRPWLPRHNEQGTTALTAQLTQVQVSKAEIFF